MFWEDLPTFLTAYMLLCTLFHSSLPDSMAACHEIRTYQSPVHHTVWQSCHRHRAAKLPSK